MIKHNGYLLVEVNRGAKDFTLTGVLHKASNWMLWYNDYYGHDGTCEILLPTGNYSIVGMAKDLTEDQWKEIVDEDHNFFKMELYKFYGGKNEVSATASAKLSGLSLLASHSLKETQTLILKSVV